MLSGGSRWALNKLHFTSNGAAGKANLDTGATHTFVTLDFITRAQLPITSGSGDQQVVILPDGTRKPVLGTASVPMHLQLSIQSEDGPPVYWHRGLTLHKALVLDLGAESPNDLYVAWPDWHLPDTPLGSLVDLIRSGATISDDPRAATSPPIPIGAVVIQRTDNALPTVTSARPGEAQAAFTPPRPPPAQLPSGRPPTVDAKDIEAQIRAKIATSTRPVAPAIVERLVAGLVARAKVFQPLDVSELTKTVDFELIPGVTPVPVSFKVPIRKGAHEAAATAGLEDYLNSGVAERVPWDTPAYGFVIIIPKADGKFRVTINPTGVNSATKDFAPPGGYMPANMIGDVLRCGLHRRAHQLDFLNAFLTMRLGPTARALSTFTTPLGKLRWNVGWFGFKNFPGLWQTIVMENIVLPTLDQFNGVDIANWVDDMIIAARDDEHLVDSLFAIVDRMLAIGARLNIKKLNLFCDEVDWCGINLNLATNKWRIAPGRVKSLRELPLPNNREALTHVLGILRYYYFGVSDHNTYRARIAILSELDVPGARVSSLWKQHHTDAMRGALDQIADSAFISVFNPAKPVFVTTDASGNHGYCITAHQYGDAGNLQPIAFFSHGWLSTQLLWPPQVKEQYARRQAACKDIPTHFPFATVSLLGDNHNLSSGAASEDPRVRRWQHDIVSSGVTYIAHDRWVSGADNTIADFGSRAAQARPNATLSPEERHELRLLALTLEPSKEGRAPPAATATTVPGHLHMAPLVAKIAAAQRDAPEGERATWTGNHYTTVTLAGCDIRLYHNKLLVPQGATDIQRQLLNLAHDDNLHYLGGERTLLNLQRHARVHWHGIDTAVKDYVSSCFKCQLAKLPHGKPEGGQLVPTLAPHVHHTWYADFKGPMPDDTGYILLVVEALSRAVKIRFANACTAKELLEELEEVILSFGTRPLVIRSDGGPPFDSTQYKDWCASNGITPIKGLAHHSQGQALVETRFHGLATSLMATLGAKAPKGWFTGSTLAKLEGVINSTIVEPIQGSPTWVLTGREPRTHLSAATDWTDPEFGNNLLGVFNLDYYDFEALISNYHSDINRIQGRAQLATSLAQALTKRAYDSTHAQHTYKVGDYVLKHRVAPNRMVPHFVGPYQIKSITGDGNTLVVSHFLTPDSVEPPFHVASALPFNMSRATPAELALHQLEEGSGLVEAVLAHRELSDGTIEFNIKWHGHVVPSWLHASALTKVLRVIDYCKAHNLALSKCVTPRKIAKPAARTTSRARQS
jgi:hypothetical protein